MDSRIITFFGSVISSDLRLQAELEYVEDCLRGNLPDVDLLVRHAPNPEHFLRVSNVHETGHATRVLVLSEIIGRLYNLGRTRDKADLKVVREAAAAHDYRRVADHGDPKHGIRGRKFYLDHLVNGNDAYCSDHADCVDHDKVAYSIEWHAPDDSYAPHMTPELMCLKDGDNLDRVRGVQFGFRLNPNYLRTDDAQKLVAVAEYLFRLSNALYMSNGYARSESVIEAARLMGLVEEKSR